MKRSFFLLLVVWLCCQWIGAVQYPKKEMRAVWLTTIYGLDWPHVKAVSEGSRAMQQEAVCEMLDRLQEANFNTVFFQVRMRGDVAYRSDIEPASAIFSGKYGRLPGYDPLSFVIEECHKRGLECHAWFVTFPVGSDKTVREQGRLSVVKRHPELCKRHKGEWFLDPGVPGTTDYILALVRELVNGYDIDGIHFDYIRYPDAAQTFPDKKTYRKYGRKMRLEDWRRQNINRMVYQIYDWVKQTKPWVQVSSSPLGKYNRIPRVPNAGWTAYESVYQDAAQWLLSGKQDMIVPMMYYLHENFFPFVDNWVENANGRMIVPGLGAYRLLEEEADWALTDLTDQIDYSRYFGGAGCSFFRCGNILSDVKGIYRELRDNYYKYPAQLPPLTWLNDSVPAAPSELRVERLEGELKLSWDKPENEMQDLTYTVYYSLKDSIDTSSAQQILATNIHGTELYLPISAAYEQGYLFVVTSSTRYHIESLPSRETYYYLSKYVK